jgi:hypothetical protein
MESLQMLMWVVQIADRFVWSSLHRAISCLSCCLLLDWIPAELGICEQHGYRRGPGNYIILQHHVSHRFFLVNYAYSACITCRRLIVEEFGIPKQQQQDTKINADKTITTSPVNEGSHDYIFILSI